MEKSDFEQVHQELYEQLEEEVGFYPWDLHTDEADGKFINGGGGRTVCSYFIERDNGEYVYVLHGTQFYTPRRAAESILEEHEDYL